MGPSSRGTDWNPRCSRYLSLTLLSPWPVHAEASTGSMFGYRGHHGGTFEATYRAFPLAFIDKQSADYGDKVILPPTALHRLGELAAAAGWDNSTQAAEHTPAPASAHDGPPNLVPSDQARCYPPSPLEFMPRPHF